MIFYDFFYTIDLKLFVWFKFLFEPDFDLDSLDFPFLFFLLPVFFLILGEDVFPD
jgi:hypothetical protein